MSQVLDILLFRNLFPFIVFTSMVLLYNFQSLINSVDSNNASLFCPEKQALTKSTHTYIDYDK
ncbi:hypothetical protein OIU79_026090 [Salix purpurea]|uniref:Uncharacterized protein n=1 Tax=Salix purpurea TaxID=77065 RepID=A0A9Q0SDE9_SALPP|nr:hypothetical protein OIU79_026090 [Salix purpurea]